MSEVRRRAAGAVAVPVKIVMRLVQTLWGVVIGAGYGLLVGGSLLLISLAIGDPPVDLMIDYRKIFRFLILLATIICGSAGALVGLVVTLFRVDKIKARTIGFILGCVILAGIVFTIWPQLKNELSGIDSWIDVSLPFSIFVVLFIIFPIGLAATGVTVVHMSASSRRDKSR